MTVTLAGIPFLVLAHSDLRMLRAPGVYVLARRERGGRAVLYAGHGEEMAAIHGGRVWAQALQAGMDEALVNLAAVERLDRLQILDRIVRACAPPLNATPRVTASPSSVRMGGRG